MGTCMSKDKKGPTAAAHTASVSSSSSSSFSQDKQIQHPCKSNDSTITRPSNEEENFPITIARPSEDEGKEPTSTDKHVVEIRLPIASPSKFKASPESATLAARAMPAIARPALKEIDSTQNGGEEEAAGKAEAAGEEEAFCDRNGPSNLRNSSPTLFYSSYLSRASFSRDLAAFSRDIASLSSSPLTRSPSVNGAHDLIAAAIKAAHSPLCALAKPYSNMVHDDYLTTTRSRSLPKRFYGKDTHSNLLPFHKRSASRDAGMEHRKSMKRRPLVDPPCELMLSPRVSVRREEASGEYRVCARQAAARRAHHNQNTHLIPSKTPDMGFSWKKDRSPLRRSTRRKGADADQADHDCSHLQENQNLTQTTHDESTVLNYSRDRPPLVERSRNCSSWADATNVGVHGSFKDYKKLAKAKVEHNYENVREDRSITKNELFEEGFQVEVTQPECPNSSVYCLSEPRVSGASDESETAGVSMNRVRSIIESLTDLNLETSLFSEVEESETEVEGELDLLQFAFHEEFFPGQDLQAQQTRNLLLKEAAMDAFARPNFPSITNTEGLEESKVHLNSDLAALMSLRLTEAEVDSLKIRKVLKLLAIAESEMRKEQKTLFYNQLRMVLDSVKKQDDNSSKTGTSLVDDVKEKAVNARANSWPRSMKEPSPIVISLEHSSNQVLSTASRQEQSLKAINATAVLPPSAQLQEELALGHTEPAFQALGSCELDDLHVSVQKTGGDLAYPHPEKLSYNVYHAHLGNERMVHQLDESPNVHLSCAQKEFCVDKQELVREGYCGAEVLSKSASEVLHAVDDLLTEDNHNKRGAVDNACTFSNLNSLVDSTLLFTGVSHQPQSTPHEEACSWNEFAVNAEGTCNMPPSLPGLDEDACSHSDMSATPVDVERRKDARGNNPSEDVASDGSFEFRVRSSGASTPLSTPSTPMISTASTPRHLSPLTAQAIAEIWEAFE